MEENEKTKDSRLAREFVPALPIELTPAQWQELLSDFIQNSFVADGMCADVASLLHEETEIRSVREQLLQRKYQQTQQKQTPKKNRDS